MANRRTFLESALCLGASLLPAPRSLAAARPRAGDAVNPSPERDRHSMGSNRGPEQGANPPVITTDVGDLPYTMDNGVKVFELTAQVLQREIAPNKTIDVWGFNGSAPGPTIQVNEGDRVRVIFRNRLPEASSIHWHGFEDQIRYDGMPGISQQPVLPGADFTYEFNIHQSGTYFYHSHMAMQEMAGMLGAFIMHPKEPYQPACDKDFAILLQEYAVLPNNVVPNTMSMEFNWLVLNGKAGPASTPLIVRQGDRVRIRFVNLGMDHHPMHLHGNTFLVTGTEGGRIQPSAWWPGNTVLVGVAQARDVEFVASRPGDWMLHCHLPHHMMNQMASQVGALTRAMNRGASRAGRGSSDSSDSGDSGDAGLSAGMAMPSGEGMKNGMGMLDGSPGAPMGEDYGPSLGRGMGFGSGASTPSANGPLSAADFDAGMRGMMREMQTGSPEMGPMQMRNMMAMDMNAAGRQKREIAPGAGDVPNFPQDAFMEGPMMSMDDKVEKPENYGLVPGWSAYMQGMMTFVRVLPPDRYDQIVERMRRANRPNDPYTSLYVRS